MERIEVLEMMGELKLFGMKAAYDETLATALKRKRCRWLTFLAQDYCCSRCREPFAMYRRAFFGKS